MVSMHRAIGIYVISQFGYQGADIPDIKQVIQFSVPFSFSVWIQRAGRAGRSADINARAILLVEKAMFLWRKKGKKKGDEDENAEDSDSEIEEDSEDEVGLDSEKMEWGKKVEPELRRWIECEECRCGIADEYFNNPPVRKRELFLQLILCTLLITTYSTNT